MKIDVLLTQIREHTESWMSQCDYNIPYDYEGLRSILDEAINCNRCICEEARAKE